nr:hypothetical protein BaRGS_018391 [Batillaria attramentaria]
MGIASENLQLPATYGLASGLAVFILGALIGDWVDSTARLRAAQLSLVLQNLFVVICAGGVYAYLFLESQIKEIEGSWAVPLCHAGIIAVAVLSDLASVARTTLVLAPIATGQVMTYAGLEFGAIFIGAWNLCSVVPEYYLLWKVYNTVPALAEAKRDVRMEEDRVFGMIGTFHLPRHEAPGGAGSDRYHRLVVSGLACLSLCVVSVWMPGSPFDPFYLSRSPDTVNASTLLPASSSLNKMMDVLKFLLVVAVPDTETFGFLIIISFAFVSLGWLLYAIFVRKARGHFFHVPKCTNNNNYEKI